jgi:hypothetical protein
MADPDALRAWTFATFHTAGVVVVGVLALHATGTLGDALAGLDTATGLVVYGALWATTWATNRRVLAAASPDGAVRSLLVAGAGWGAVTGVAFLLELVALLVVARLVTVGAAVPFQPELLVLLGVVVVAAAVVGGVVGTALAAVDAGAARAARAVAGE